MAGFHHPSLQLCAVVLGAVGMQLQQRPLLNLWKGHMAFNQHRGSGGSSQPAKHECFMLEAMGLEAR